MWEFSIEMDSNKKDLAKFFFTNLDDVAKSLNAILTSYEQNQKICIVIACPEIEKNRIKYYISDVISKGICLYLKDDFLNKNLKTPPKSEIEIYTFKKALISFDRETDKFLINKYLEIDKNLVIESFFYFKLQPLKEKWEELVRIANDNSTYLLSDDSFIELLRFLIDNIEISCDEISIEIENQDIKIFDSFLNNLENNKKLNEFDIVDKILEFSPKKINWKSNVKYPFLEKVFEKRLLYVPIEKIERKNLSSKWSLQY